MKKLSITKIISACSLTALALCSGCDTQDQDTADLGAEVPQLEEGQIIDSVEYGVGLSFNLGTWDVSKQDCVLVRLIRHPDAPMDVDLLVGYDDEPLKKISEINLSNKISGKIELPVRGVSQLSLFASTWFHFDPDDVPGVYINTLVQPCR